MVREFARDPSFRRNFLSRRHFRLDVGILQGNPTLADMLYQTRCAGLETIMEVPKLATLQAALRACLPLEGDVIEFGSYRGGSGGILALTMQGSGKTLHLCDSFAGLPAPSAEDNFHHTGDFGDVDAARVQCGIEQLGCRGFTQIHVGFFAETIPTLRAERFCFAHIDVDLYESIQECLEFVYPRMTPGGIILFDDYGAPTCLGAKKAVDEWFENRPEKPVHMVGSAWAVQAGSRDPALQKRVLRGAGWTSRLFRHLLYTRY
jgi:O-methyltransferase